MSAFESAVLALAMALPAQQFAPVEPASQWSFPRDHFAHFDQKIEWWYFTGHLRSSADPARRFGYQFTLFRIGLRNETPKLDSAWAARDAIMGHLALTDLAKGEHRFSEVFWRASPLFGGFGRPGERVARCAAPPPTDGEWTLDLAGDAFAFAAADAAQRIALDLTTSASKPLVLEGENGFSAKSADATAASRYYSFTRLDTRGSIAIDGERLEVEGTSWTDHEFSSSQLAPQQVGWDWFSIQLDDGRELMLYALRDAKGALDFGRGTLVEKDGRATYLGPSDWTATAKSTWSSAPTGARYPLRWHLVLPAHGLDLDVVPLLDDQENRSRLLPRLFYWEGAIEARDTTGAPIGRGYLELTGYGRDNRLPL